LSFVALVCSQNFAQIGTFEGTYDDEYGGNLYVCQNGNVLQGAYSEVGVVNGIVADNKVTGKFFQAGYSDCNIGTFEWTLTDEGFEGNYTCNNIPGTFPWVQKKYDVFRPSDDQCALLYDGDGSTQGHWTIENGHWTLDSCFTSADAEDQFTVHVSYQTENDGEVHPNVGLIHGFSVFNGKIFVGTWYEDFVGGAVLGFLNIKQELVLYYWTGLAGRQGGSIIDAEELHVPEYHWITKYHNSQKTSLAQCTRNEYLSDYVNNALYYYQDGNLQYVYFVYNPSLQFDVDVGFDAIDYLDTNYYINVILSANSSNYLNLSVLAVVVALFFF
jgi:hypothetical protein